jgi:hypothetical protein
MTDLSDHEDWLDELDKKLNVTNEGISSLFGPEEYYVGYKNMQTESEVIQETLRFSLSQIDYLPGGDYLPQRFMRAAYNKLRMWDKVNDIYREYAVHAFRNISSSTNDVSISEKNKSVSIGFHRKKTSLKVERATDKNSYIFEMSRDGYLAGMLGKAIVKDFEICVSKSYLVIILPSDTSWRHFENEMEVVNKLESFYRISIPFKYLDMNINTLHEYLQLVKNS